MLLLFSYNSPQSRRSHITLPQISIKVKSSSNAGLIFFPLYLFLPFLLFQIQKQVKINTLTDTARAPKKNKAYKATLESSKLVEI